MGAAPARGDALLARRSVDSRLSRIELWSDAGLAATLDDTVPDNPDQWFCPTTLEPLAYDGRYVWAVVGGTLDCTSCSAPLRSRLFRADLTTGDVTEAWAAADGAEQVLGIVPSPDGSVSLLSGPAVGALGAIHWVPAAGLEWPGARTWTLDAPLVHAAVSVAGVDPLVRPYVTYTTRGEIGSTLHVVALGETEEGDEDEEVMVDLTNRLINPVIGGVSPDGSGVLVIEDWEGIAHVALVRLDGAAAGRSEFESVGSAACWTDSGLVARSTWSFSSEGINDSPGTIEFVDPRDLSVVADLGLDTFGGALGCLMGERVALSAYDESPMDGATAEVMTEVPGSRRLVIAGRGTLLELPPDPNLWVNRRNADD